MTNLTITGDWRQRIRGVEPWLTQQIPARHRAKRYERCPWVWPGLHIVVDTKQEAQLAMAQTARVVRFMDASELRPYGRRWEFKLRDMAPSLVPLGDHPMLWRDGDGGLVVTVEPYADVGDGIHQALVAWARYKGWQYQVADTRAAMWNPDMGCRLLMVMAPPQAKKGGDVAGVCDSIARHVAGDLPLAIPGLVC